MLRAQVQAVNAQPDYSSEVRRAADLAGTFRRARTCTSNRAGLFAVLDKDIVTAKFQEVGLIELTEQSPV